MATNLEREIKYPKAKRKQPKTQRAKKEPRGEHTAEESGSYRTAAGTPIIQKNVDNS